MRLMERFKHRGNAGAVAGEEEEGSASSALSPHSHRHLHDLDEDDSACEEELARLASQVNNFLLHKKVVRQLMFHPPLNTEVNSPFSIKQTFLFYVSRVQA